MGLKLKIAYNTLFQIIGKIVSAGTTFLITSLISRSFGPYIYGEFTKIVTYLPLFYLVGDFGINAIFLRAKKDSRIKAKEELDFSYLLGLRLIWSLILIFLAISLLSFLPYNSAANQGFTPLVKLGIIIGSLTILTQSLYTSLNAVFQNSLRYDLSNLALSIGSITGLILVYLISTQKAFNFLGKNRILLIILSYEINYLLTFLTAFFFAKKIEKNLTFKFNFSVFRKVFFNSLPLGITLIFNLIYFRIDTFILTFYRQTTEVGFYGLAYRFFETILVIPSFFMNSVYPLMLEKAKEGKEEFKKFLIFNFKFLILISFICSLFLILSSKFLITLVAGDNFLPAVFPLKILSLTLPLFFLSSLTMWVLITLKKQNLLAIFYGTSMILNIVLNLIFIPKYGMLAAAITTGATELFVLLLTGYTSLKNIKN